MLPVRLYLFIALICIAIPSIGQDYKDQNTASSQNHTELKATKEEIRKLQREVDRLSLQIESQKGHQAKDIAWVNKRVEDLNDNRASTDQNLTVFGFLLTVVILVFAFNQVAAAKTEARLAAEEEIKNRSVDLIKKHDDKLSEKSQNSLNKIEDLANKKLEELNRYTETANQKVQQIEIAHEQIKLEASYNNSLLITRGEEKLTPLAAENKPEELRSFEDSYALTIKHLYEKDNELKNHHISQARKKAISHNEIAKTANIEAIIFSEENQFQEAISRLDQVLTNPNLYRNINDRVLAELMLNKAENLLRLKRYNDSISQYSDYLVKFGDINKIRDLTAIAFYNQANAFYTLGQLEDGIKNYNQIIQRFSPIPELQLQVVSSILAKGAFLNELNEPRKAIKQFDRVLSDFDTDPALQNQVAHALLYKVYSFTFLKEYTNAIHSCDSILDRYQEQPELQELVASASLQKAYVYIHMKQHENALRQFNSVIQDYRYNAAAQEQFARALVYGGLCVVVQT